MALTTRFSACSAVWFLSGLRPEFRVLGLRIWGLGVKAYADSGFYGLRSEFMRLEASRS